MFVVFTSELLITMNSSSSSALIINDDDDECKSPLILDGTFFQIVRQKENNVEAICLTCKLHYKGFLNATSNFSKHLKVFIIF